MTDSAQGERKVRARRISVEHVFSSSRDHRDLKMRGLEDDVIEFSASAVESSSVLCWTRR